MFATRFLFTGGLPDVPPTVPGTWAPSGSKVIIDSGTGHRAFPGVAWLSATKLLLVYRFGSDHLTDGVIAGRIGTVNGTSVSWGTEFTIYSNAEDVRCDDSVSVLGTSVVITGRLYDGTNNHSPFVLVCDDAAGSLSASSTWTKHDIAFSAGANQNGTTGRVLLLGSTYVVATFAITGSSVMVSGVLRNSSLTDWSSPTYVVIGSDGQLPETCLGELSGGTLLALLRRQTGSQTYAATSSDDGVTWTTPASAHDGFGYPMFRMLGDTTILTVYRDSPNGDTAWRQSLDQGETWSSESILDTTGDRNVYATIAQLDDNRVLCIYAVEASSQTDGDLYSQIFTRS